jgi:hypothetical protein
LFLLLLLLLVILWNIQCFTFGACDWKQNFGCTWWSILKGWCYFGWYSQDRSFGSTTTSQWR